MDQKDTWAVVKFIIAGTGFKRRDARKILAEIPEDKFSKLFLKAYSWDREMAHKASAALAEVVGEDTMETLKSATIMAQSPAGGSEDDEEEVHAAPPARSKAPRKPRRK